jgi:transposase
MDRKKYSQLETMILYEEQNLINISFPDKKKKQLPEIEEGNFTTKNLRTIVSRMREKGFYVPKKEDRKIDWQAYTANQINDIIDSLHFIRDEVDKIHTPKKYFSVGRPPTDAGILAKAILFIELFGIPERKAEGWIILIGPHLGIKERIDDRVIGKAYKRLQVISILYRVFEKNKSSDNELGGDGTGLEQSRKENYESTKKKGKYLTSIVDSREIVQVFDTSGKQECVIMHQLVKEVAKDLKKDVNLIMRKAKLTLDSGFVDKKLAQLIEDSGIIPYIFPKKNNKLNSDSFPGWKRMLIKLIENVQEWLKEYHVRSHTESFHSSFKRIFGLITKRLDETIHTQVLARIIHNNRRKTNYFRLAEF